MKYSDEIFHVSRKHTYVQIRLCHHLKYRKYNHHHDHHHKIVLSFFFTRSDTPAKKGSSTTTCTFSQSFHLTLEVRSQMASLDM
mmetsp:Transcript_6892/g.11375  ORF Transcript_6892/g.11375 Transcript_6892/m.11375 type:complete len:84 (+) Transcript_6892:426-677(+)